MFRDNKKRETKAIYRIPGNSAPINRAKAMKAHASMFYENKTKVFGTFQHMSGVDTSSIERALEKLQCKDFYWYLEHFAHIYRDAGLIPKQVFQITPDGGKTCLALQSPIAWGGAVSNENLVTVPCDTHDGFSAAGGVQFFHLSARNSDGKCCSGLRMWNTNACLAAGMKAKWCYLDGDGQKAELTPEGYLKVEGKCWDGRNNQLSEAECSEGSTKWTKLRPFVPSEYLLLTPELKAIW